MKKERHGKYSAEESQPLNDDLSIPIKSTIIRSSLARRFFSRLGLDVEGSMQSQIPRTGTNVDSVRSRCDSPLLCLDIPI